MSKLQLLEPKALQASHVVTKHGSAYCNQLLEQNMQEPKVDYVSSAVGEDKCSDDLKFDNAVHLLQPYCKFIRGGNND